MFHRNHATTRAASIALACGLLGAAALGQAPRRPAGPAPRPEAYESVAELLDSIQRDPASQTGEAPRVKRTRSGFVRFLATPPGAFLPIPDAGQEPDAIASELLRRTRKLIGADDPTTRFVTIRTKEGSTGRTVVKLQQTFAGLPVFGSQVVVQLGAGLGLECLVSDIDHDAVGLRAAVAGRSAVLPAQDVVAKAVASLDSAAPIETTAPSLQIFSPEVLGSPGDAVLVWLFETRGGSPATDRRFLVDARRGDVVRNYPLCHDALSREVYDANNTSAYPGTLVRTEGQGASGIADVDTAYDFLGDTYAFYDTNHGRDSIDGAGLVLSATVRYCDPLSPCPYGNAFWNGARMVFGEGYASDDVTGHELTHGVTQYESGLIYENLSGAINESFSDIWGEFVDLGNGAGDDSPGARWLIGEDIPIGAIRDMQDPPVFGDPDRLLSGLFIFPVPVPDVTNDYGGVHTNSGVSNKLCALLTDGGTFNGELVFAMGIPTVADLYYEAQVNLLMPSSDYFDLGDALQQAAVNLGWTLAQRDNVFRACVAVEIEFSSLGSVYVDLANNGAEDGSAANPFNTVTEGEAALTAGDQLVIVAGTYDEPPIVFDTLTRVSPFGGVVVIQ